MTWLNVIHSFMRSVNNAWRKFESFQEHRVFGTNNYSRVLRWWSYTLFHQDPTQVPHTLYDIIFRPIHKEHRRYMFRSSIITFKCTVINHVLWTKYINRWPWVNILVEFDSSIVLMGGNLEKNCRRKKTDLKSACIMGPVRVKI